MTKSCCVMSAQYGVVTIGNGQEHMPSAMTPGSRCTDHERDILRHLAPVVDDHPVNPRPRHQFLGNAYVAVSDNRKIAKLTGRSNTPYRDYRINANLSHTCEFGHPARSHCMADHKFGFASYAQIVSGIRWRKAR